ncbi:MAG: CopG family antitoxin [Pyrinomonadaceae bacterium]
MPNKKKVRDPLPESFANEEEAGEFWDTHSVDDYAEYFVPVNIEFDIQKRTYQVQISEDVFETLTQVARKSHEPVRKTVDRILRKELLAA